MEERREILDERERRQQQENELAADIIDECRVQLMLKFRFLDLALWRMEIVPARMGMAYPLATNADQLMCDPARVISRFGFSYEESIRDYLHLIMHCIFRHPFNKDYENKEAWNLTCDVIVENAVMDLCAGRFASNDDDARRQALSEIAMHCGQLLPNKVYGLLRNIVDAPEGTQYLGMGRTNLNEWHYLFERDDHGAWPANSDSMSDEGADGGGSMEVSEDGEEADYEQDGIRTETAGEGQEPEDAGGQDTQTQESAMESDSGSDTEVESEDDEADGADNGQDVSGSDARDDQPDSDDSEPEQPRDSDAADDAVKNDEENEREWEDISKQIEMNLETFSKEWGDEAGSLMANLALVNRKKYSYTDFLRSFMAVTEEMQLNMDEFDYIYYTYGMDLYGNLPLIEPLEYKDTDRIHDFVIAIDTSESVSGTLVRRFITHTFDILKDGSDFATDVNVHIIQCDSKVQSDVRITNLRDVDAAIENLVVRGFGGTDFRPTFDYIDVLRKRNDLIDLKGMIYFTDGLGQFPEATPDYDVAFVFMDDEERDLPPVPPWAMKVVLDEVGINRLDVPTETATSTVSK